MFDPTPVTRMTMKTLPLLFVLLVAAFAYNPILQHNFVLWDDDQYIEKNPHVATGLSGENLIWAFSGFHLANYHPLTWISLQLDASLWGLDPFGFHLTNLILHLVNGALLWCLLKRVRLSEQIVLVVVLLFLLHPVHVESVAWVTERKDLLFFLFGILAMISYVNAAQNRSTEELLPAEKLVMPCIWTLCSLLSKPMLVTMPLLLLTLDFWPLGRYGTESLGPTKKILWRSFSLLLEKWPIWLLVVTFCVFTVLAQKSGGAVASLEVFGLEHRLANAIVSPVRYLSELFWPVGLSFFYRPLTFHSLDERVLGSTAFLLAVTLVVWFQKRKRPYLLMGWGWFLLSLLPVIGILQVGNQSMADRYMYLPAIGIYLACSMLLGTAFVPLSNNTKSSLSSSFYGSVALLGLVLAGMTYQQAIVWRSSESLFLHALTLDPQNDVALGNLGVYYLDKQNYPSALHYLDQAVANQTRITAVFRNRAVARFQLNQLTGAIEDLTLATTLEPDNAEWWELLGVFQARAGDAAQAIQSYHQALRVDPDNSRLLFNLAVAYERQGEVNSAAKAYQKACQLDPTMLDACRLAEQLSRPVSP